MQAILLVSLPMQLLGYAGIIALAVVGFIVMHEILTAPCLDRPDGEAPRPAPDSYPADRLGRADQLPL